MDIKSVILQSLSPWLLVQLLVFASEHPGPSSQWLDTQRKMEAWGKEDTHEASEGSPLGSSRMWMFFSTVLFSDSS